jgi:RNA 2',3'-cyclic 3'-phosphodiesterase
MRLFVAVNPGQQLRDGVATFLDEIRDRWPLKWVDPQNLHITLRFLGELPEDHLDTLKQTLFTASLDCDRFTVKPGGVGTFPVRGRPRVLYLHMQDDGRLGELAGRLNHALRSAFPDLPQPEAAYRAHLTLGRTRRGDSCPDGEALRRLATPGFADVPVHEFQLIQSFLTPSGPIYRNMAVFPLAATRGT